MKLVWKTAWVAAVEAGCEMMDDLRLGSDSFKKLFDEYPSDGMIFYERAEAFEFNGMLDEAKKDYIKAKELMSRPEWKKLAQYGIDRCENNMNSAYSEFEKNYHEIHTLSKLSAHSKQKFLCLYAMTKIAAENEIVLIMFREVIEKIVKDENECLDDEFNLNDELNKLKQNPKYKKILNSMHNLRTAGNAVLHDIEKYAYLADDINERVNDCMKVIRVVYK